MLSQDRSKYAVSVLGSKSLIHVAFAQFTFVIPMGMRGATCRLLRFCNVRSSLPDSALDEHRYFDKYATMKSKDVVKSLAALAQESRLAVFQLLVKRGPEGFTPSELSEKLDIPAPTLSFHLKELQNAGLVASRREGRFLFYSARFDRMKVLVAFLTDECCSQAEEACDDDCKPVVAQAKRRSA
jgi:ArsR family transcriptional regulator